MFDLINWHLAAADTFRGMVNGANGAIALPHLPLLQHQSAKQRALERALGMRPLVFEEPEKRPAKKRKTHNQLAEWHLFPDARFYSLNKTSGEWQLWAASISEYEERVFAADVLPKELVKLVRREYDAWMYDFLVVLHASPAFYSM